MTIIYIKLKKHDIRDSKKPSDCFSSWWTLLYVPFLIYLNWLGSQKVLAIFILSQFEVKGLSHFHFIWIRSKQQLSYGQPIFSWRLPHVPEYFWIFLHIPEAKHKNNQECDTQTNQRTNAWTEPHNYYIRCNVVLTKYAVNILYSADKAARDGFGLDIIEKNKYYIYIFIGRLLRMDKG